MEGEPSSPQRTEEVPFQNQRTSIKPILGRGLHMGPGVTRIIRELNPLALATHEDPALGEQSKPLTQAELDLSSIPSIDLHRYIGAMMG